MTGNFADAYDEHIADVYGFFAYRLARRDDAEDLTQQTFERALRSWPSFDALRAPVGVWLFSIARNILIDHYRADKTSRQEPLENVAEERLGATTIEPDLGLDPNLSDALDELSPRDREVVALRFGADLSGPEISEILDLGLANVQQILSRSLRRMRSTLDRPADRQRDPSVDPPTAKHHRDRP
jgi:RNA polymerase sigma factor (sigma-70 family)